MLYKIGIDNLTVYDEIDIKNFDINLNYTLKNHFNICPNQPHKDYILKLRTILKHENKFDNLLSILKLDHKTFIENTIKIYPEVFSKHLIRIIRSQYGKKYR